MIKRMSIFPWKVRLLISQWAKSVSFSSPAPHSSSIWNFRQSWFHLFYYPHKFRKKMLFDSLSLLWLHHNKIWFRLHLQNDHRVATHSANIHGAPMWGITTAIVMIFRVGHNRRVATVAVWWHPFLSSIIASFWSSLMATSSVLWASARLRLRLWLWCLALHMQKGVSVKYF
jgi:hypothetical protein